MGVMPAAQIPTPSERPVIAFFDVLRGCLKPEKAAMLSANQPIVNFKAAEKQT